MEYVLKLAALILLVAAEAGAALSQPGILLTPGTGIQIATDGAGTTNYLSCRFGPTNIDAGANEWVLQKSLDFGVTWTNAASDVHSTNTLDAAAKPYQTNFWVFRIYQFHTSSPGTISPYSTNVGIWAEGSPILSTETVLSTNSVKLTFQSKSLTETGFELWRATDPTFTNVIQRIAVGPTNTQNGFVSVTDTGGYARDQIYYWRFYATNSLTWSNAPYRTQPQNKTISDTPNALCGAPSKFDARNGANGVNVSWTRGSGSVLRWYIDVSVGDTNNWRNVYNTPGGSYSYTTTDHSEANGTLCYYRCLSSNEVGIASSAIIPVYISPVIVGATWYIDREAAGNNSGTNWANAWPNFASIAWGNVKPGATIWIAKGTYPEVVFCTDVDGSNGAPILFKVAQDSAHIGKVYLNGAVLWRQWVQWDGAANDLFVPSTTYDITNNINLVFGATNVQLAFSTSMNGGMNGFSLKWAECNKVANPELLYTNFNIYFEGSTAGVSLNGRAYTNNELAYVWIHDIEGDGLDTSLGAPTNWGAINIHHCLIQRCRGNLLSATGGDIHDMIIEDEWRKVGVDTPPGVHPDGSQVYPPYLRYYNNRLRDTTGEGIYVECFLTNTHSIQIYNNVVYGTGAKLLTEAVEPKSGIDFSTEPSSYIATAVISNVLIANNTFFGFDFPYLSVNRRSSVVGNLQLRSWLVANNLFYDTQAGSQQSISSNDFYTADVAFVSNDCAGSNTAMSYKGTTYPTMSALNADLGFTNNFSYTPALQNAVYKGGWNLAWDFHLTPSDVTNAVGVSLASYPAINLDRNADGTLRSTTGWPVGPFSKGEGDGLVLWLNFNGWSSGTLSDSGPHTNNAILSGYSTNSPYSMAGPKAGIGGAAFGEFQYLAVTNWGGLDYLPHGTIALWCVFSNAAGNSLILDGGYDGVTNSWRFGRVDGNTTTMFVTYNPTNGVRDYQITYPDSGANTTNWNHYAVTWDGTNAIGYWNGVAFSTNALGYPLYTGSPHHWIAVGTMHHTGTPEYGDDAYPNCCWLSGALADARIYNRALSSNEVYAIYSGGGVETPSGGGGDPIITGQPQSTTVTVGQTASFTVQASGLTALEYQWYKNGSLISGASQSIYTTPATVISDDGATFHVTVADIAGPLPSDTATLTVLPQAPKKMRGIHVKSKALRSSP